ncbi:hypothetical protein [Dokdonella sp.]|uniref:hypothetical protein n=1 Tax=Dokdonella sp. TaxID=2291710 RepID=UPI00260492BA|nr:hypothetical protein [Dokdonella sp.]
MDDNELKRRLAEWADAYGGEQYRRLGYSSAERIAFAAPEPTTCSGADEIESIVQAMEQGGRWKEARVLRAECFLAALSEVERIQRLTRIGLPMSRASYYIFLGSARSFICGALTHRLAA